MSTTQVRVVTRNVGDGYGVVAVVRSARTNRVLAQTRIVPHGNEDAARKLAADIVQARGYTEASW